MSLALLGPIGTPEMVILFLLALVAAAIVGGIFLIVKLTRGGK